MRTPYEEPAPDLDGRDPAALADAARSEMRGVSFGDGRFTSIPCRG